MNFYVIGPSLNKSVVGHYPQVKDIHQNCHVWNEPRFIERVTFEKIDFEPITANAILYDSSKTTDLIDAVGIGFTKKLLISDKLKGIIGKSRKSGLQFFRSDVIHNKNPIKDYRVLNVFEDGMKFVDYSKSTFVFRKRKLEGGTYLDNARVSSYQDKLTYH